MAERMRPEQRVRLRNVAEREIQRFAGDHALWHKHVHNVELDPAQVLKMVEMDQSPNTIDYSCRRTGKTAVKELYELEHNARHADQEVGIVAPREAQSINNLNYHLDAIRRSEILTAWLGYKNGRKQLGDTYYQFANRSVARAYGIMAQVDGGDLTSASLEEVDDMPRERLYNRFLLMLGANRRLGASKESRNEPTIRITGVFKGADTLSDMVAGGTYSILPTIDVYTAIEMGILNEGFMTQMREELSPDEYMRQLLCVNVSSRNLIWEKYVRRALQIGLKSRLEIAAPLPGAEYKRRGLIGMGYDAGGHGDNPSGSKHACVITEQIGNFITVPYARTWAPNADDALVRRDLLGIWRYFRPDYGIGDAYGVGLLSQLNDDLFREGLTTIDRRTIGDGDSSKATWPEWAFSPMWFEGQVKHQMAQAVRSIFHNGHAALPYLDDFDPTDADTADLRALVRQLPNIKPVHTGQAYPRYEMVDKKIGDDLFDAIMAAVWALATRGLEDVPTVVRHRRQSRDDLLGRTLELPGAAA